MNSFSNDILAKDNIEKFSAIEIQEADRQRIARDLHDISLQNLAHLTHKIELCSMYIDKDPIQAKLELAVVNKNIKSIIDEMRNIIFDLRPMTFDDLGLKAALERLVDIINEKKAYEFDVSIDDVSCENNSVLVFIYRAIRESLMNIVKHAEATKIIFHCKLIDGIYHVSIIDNGKGFTWVEVDAKADKHFGLLLIRERIQLIDGKLDIQSGKDGTSIKMTIPVE